MLQPFVHQSPFANFLGPADVVVAATHHADYLFAPDRNSPPGPTPGGFSFALKEQPGSLIYALYETNIWYFQGFEAGLIAFTAAVMGGIGNVRGAVLGGLIIGVIQALSDARMGPQWTEAVVFGYLIIIMILRPRGLLGEETREAG